MPRRGRAASPPPAAAPAPVARQPAPAAPAPAAPAPVAAAPPPTAVAPVQAAPQQPGLMAQVGQFGIFNKSRMLNKFCSIFLTIPYW